MSRAAPEVRTAGQSSVLATRPAIESIVPFRGRPSNAHRAPRILIAEDNGTLRRLLVDIVRETIGDAVVAAVDDGAAALLAIDDGAALDLLLSDVMMPVMDGFELLRQVKERRPDLPVIMMSAADEEGPARRLGADDYLSKPFELVELTEKLDHWLTDTYPAQCARRCA